MYIEENSKPKEKLKAWYLFTEDFIAGTQHLTNEQIGIYIRLLCWNWNKRCCGLPSDNMTIYRIANCITDDEKQSCNIIVKEFFILINDHYQNERQLEEYLYITRRIEASKVNGRLGGRPKKPSQNPPTLTPTTTTLPQVEKLYKKTKTKHNFDIFWKKVKNKVSKGTAEKNFSKLTGVWQEQPEYVAELYNKYYDLVEDKKFAKQPAFWLSARKYEDEEPKKENNQKISQYEYRLEMFKKAIFNQHKSKFILKYAKSHSYDVRRAIEEGHFTKEQAIKHLDMKGWL